MSSNVKNNKKLTLISLVLMIFTSVFGFANMPRSFYLMGYGAIPWYILSAITFFIPFAFMMAEYGAAFKNEKGGIYSWMSRSVNPKYAFIGTFMWYASYIIWMVNVSSSIWIVFSTAIFGTDTTSAWSLFGLNSTQTLGLLGVAWIALVSFISTKGLDKIKKITSVGGSAVALLNIVLLIGSMAILIGNGGKIAQPILGIQSFVQSPNPGYQNPIAILAFLVFAIFAYGGTEVVGGLVDQTENAEVTFPKGIMIASIIISIGYAIGIFLCGIFVNWNQVLSSENVNMANVAYIMMNNMGYELGHAFGLNKALCISLGNWIARYVGISMLLALTGAFFTLTYAPLKQIIQGTPKELWPGKMGELNEDGMPINAMKIQAIIVIFMILAVSFGGDKAATFFTKLVLMTNVAMTLPYMFIAAAFAPFKKKTEIYKPFEIFKTYKSGLIASIIVTFTVGFANFFTIIEPAIKKGDIASTIWSIAGPVIFTIIALIMYNRYEKKVKKQKIKQTA
ncbi:glutamate/gamma-aminobutyrate family transporter YjeM [Tepidibacter thalassicus]|uniref:Amino acid/polyamine/organocation transporter, APC superfamily n=1 Tax=Tepidibacter thalassicus DSM 15285 TaxID=1123350 RepID=A0A1M5NT04_9FIRM|nr:glutamate/gamma-aminobutyrate family transporter YjeM [Tepidibacter thalassicus]SHG92329.1 amino acid/polyamine/organocation transporter, APC superfamily [Tepidibacter thalassicus DSM 15285]